MIRFAAFLLLSIASAFALAETPAVELLCSDPPPETEGVGLSNDFAGKIERDASGAISARAWARHSDNLLEAKAYLEGDVLRLVAGSPENPLDAKPCKTGHKHIAQVRLPGWSNPALPTLRVERLRPSPRLPPPATVEISSAFDCGGPISKDYYAAEAAGQLLETQALGERTVVVTLLQTFVGSEHVEPTFSITGNKLVVGYTTKSVWGPACVFHMRTTYRVSGVDAKKVTVVVDRPFSLRQLTLANVSGFVIAIIGLILIVRALLKRYRRDSTTEGDPAPR